MIKIAIDCLGGDHSPDANIDGTLAALNKHSDLCVVLFGDESVIKSKLEGKKYDKMRVEIVHAPVEVTGDDKPIDAFRLKKQSSMVSSVSRMREDETISALVSVGSTAVLVGTSILRLGRIEGVRRPAFCPVLPTMNGGVVGLSDSGANVDCTPLQLHQYAVMASAYMTAMFGVENPRVALLNIGVEPEKGDDLHREAYKLLAADKNLNFVGNMESRDFLSGKYDLVVSDAFSGNVLIKSTEGTALELLKKIKKDIMSSFINKLGALFLKKMFMQEKEFMNYHNYGGSVLLGLEKIVVKGHGSSNAKAFEICVDQAYKLVGSDLAGKIEKGIATTVEQDN